MLYCYIIKNTFYECVLKYPSLIEEFLNMNQKQKKEIFYEINKVEIQKKGECFFQTTMNCSDNLIWFQDDCLNSIYQIVVLDDRIRIDSKLNPFLNFLKRIYPTCIFIEEK